MNCKMYITKFCYNAFLTKLLYLYLITQASISFLLLNRLWNSPHYRNGAVLCIFYKICTKLICNPLKGTVSGELRWVLLYVYRKLFSRAETHHHIFILFKDTLQFKKIVKYCQNEYCRPPKGTVS